MRKVDTSIKKIGVYDGMHHDTDLRHRLITETVQHRATRQDAAMSSHYEEFYLYSKLDVRQEKCPCWRDQDPKATCPLCNGFGYLPPYERIGFHTISSLHAAAQSNALNLVCRLDTETSLPMWYLRDTAFNGRLESAWLPIQTNDAADIDLWTGLTETDEVHFSYEFLLKGESEWRPIVDLERFLTKAQAVKLRFTVSRDTLEENVAPFPGLFLRYRVAGCPNIKGTQPQWLMNMDRAATGMLDLIDSGQFVCSGKQLTTVEVGDFFHHIRENYRFRVTSINSSKVNGELIEWDLQVRKVTAKELLAQIV